MTDSFIDRYGVVVWVRQHGPADRDNRVPALVIKSWFYGELRQDSGDYSLWLFERACGISR